MAYIDDELARMDAEIDDMNFVQAKMTKQGYGLGDYDLESLTNLRTQQRKAEEEEAKRQAEMDITADETTPLAGDSVTQDPPESTPPTLAQPPTGEVPPKPKPIGTINDMPLYGTGAGIASTTPTKSAVGIESSYKGGGEFRLSDKALEYRDVKGEGSGHSAGSLYVRQTRGLDDPNMKYGKEFTVTPEMIRDMPSLKEQMKKLGTKKVRQVYNYGTLVDGKPTAYFEPAVDIEVLSRSLPRESQFAKDLNASRKHSEALKKAYEDEPRLKEMVEKDAGLKRMVYDITY